MFDFAWSELGIIALVSVLVLGPKQLPETMRTMAKVMRRVRTLGAEFQGHVNEMIREAELEELRQKVKQFSETNVTEQVTKVVDPTGELSGQMQIEAPAGEGASDPHATPAAAEPTAAPAAVAAPATPPSPPGAEAPAQTPPPETPGQKLADDPSKTAA